jgi:xanthine dehydrogenase YagR molybdenum-binding subunit
VRHFIEVRVDEDFGTVRVSRVVSALDCGRIYNPKLAESQWKGGIIMGIGQALLEEGIVDRRNGRVINNNLGDYLIATNADIPDIEVISVGIPDPHASILGGKASANCRSSAWRPPSPTPCSTRRAKEFAICRSRSRS